jgi:hypothetical protein
VLGRLSEIANEGLAVGKGSCVYIYRMTPITTLLWLRQDSQLRCTFHPVYDSHYNSALPTDDCVFKMQLAWSTLFVGMGTNDTLNNYLMPSNDFLINYLMPSIAPAFSD